MNDWRRAVAQYQQGVQSVAQSNLQEKEALLQGKASLVSGKVGQDEVMAATSYGDMLTAEGHKLAGDLGVDLSLGATMPTIMRGASRLAAYRSRVLNRRWKTTQAERFNEQEQARGQEAEDVEPEDLQAGDLPEPEVLFPGRAAVPARATNIRATTRS